MHAVTIRSVVMLVPPLMRRDGLVMIDIYIDIYVHHFCRANGTCATVHIQWLATTLCSVPVVRIAVMAWSASAAGRTEAAKDTEEG